MSVARSASSSASRSNSALSASSLPCNHPPTPQSEDPAVRWQLNLYKDIAMRSEGPPDPDRVVDRIQRISAAVFNLEQVSR